MGDGTESEREAGNYGWMGTQREGRVSISFGNIRVHLIIRKNLLSLIRKVQLSSKGKKTSKRFHGQVCKSCIECDTDYFWTLGT